MQHPLLYFACVFGGLFAVTLGLMLVARATKWEPKPMKPAWAIILIFAAVLVAGGACSIYGKDVHILYWWLLGAPAVVIGIPLVVIPTQWAMRLFMRLIFSMFQSKR